MITCVHYILWLVFGLMEFFISGFFTSRTHQAQVDIFCLISFTWAVMQNNSCKIPLINVWTLIMINYISTIVTKTKKTQKNHRLPASWTTLWKLFLKKYNTLCHRHVEYVGNSAQRVTRKLFFHLNTLA